MTIAKARMHNKYKFEIYDTISKETEYAYAENIVLDQLYSYINSSDWFGYICVGTGTGTLSTARTSMFSYLVGTESSASEVEIVYDTDVTAHRTKKRVFSETEAIGIWTEVGINATANSTKLMTHAFIKDSEGNTITINKTATKIVTVYATVYAELLVPFNNADSNFYAGATNLLLAKMLGKNPLSVAGIFCTSLLQTNGKPSKLGITSLPSSIALNVDATNKRLYTGLLRYGVSQNNYPIRGIIVSNSPSDAGKGYGATSLPNNMFAGKAFAGISIGAGDGTNKNFDFPLDWIKPESEVIYVDGVAKVKGTDYTIHYGQKSTSTKLLDMDDSTKTLGKIDEIIVLPQPEDDAGASIITSIVCNFYGTSKLSYYKVELSVDDNTWVEAGSGTLSANAVKTMNTFTPAKYRYMKVLMYRDSATNNESGTLNYMYIYATPPATKQIQFTNAPASGAVITADFAVDYIPKSSNYVLDLQAELLLGGE